MSQVYAYNPISIYVSVTYYSLTVSNDGTPLYFQVLLKIAVSLCSGCVGGVTVTDKENGINEPGSNFSLLEKGM